jgi:hypothetical protein
MTDTERTVVTGALVVLILLLVWLTVGDYSAAWPAVRFLD